MTRSRLIGFNGGMGVGKSTAIRLLEDVLGYPPSLVKFAGPLYDMQEYIYNRISSVYTRPPEFTKDRMLLQWLGTDWGRNTIDKNLWVNLWKADVKSALDKGYFVVCDDVRFDNEAELVRSFGGIVINISRKDGTEHAQGGVGIKNHASESGIALSLIDAHITNDSTLEEYKNQLADAYNLLGIEPVTG